MKQVTEGLRAQGDCNFVPLSTWGKTAADIDRSQPLTAFEGKSISFLEGEQHGHIHGIWFPRPVMFHDAALAGGIAAKMPVIPAPARFYRDDRLAAALPLDRTFSAPPVIGFLIADEPVTVRHAVKDGTRTHEHGDVKLPAGAYVVLGKREMVAGDVRRVAD